MIRALLFDFNGVLVDDEPLHGELLARVLAEEGVPAPVASGADWYVGVDDRTAFRRAFTSAGRLPSERQIARLVARKAAFYEQTIRATGYPYFPGAAACVREAAGAELSLALVSGARRAEVEAGLAQEGLLGLFQVVVTADEVERGKPDPEGYARALAAVDARRRAPGRPLVADEAVAIEDSPAGLEAAVACGLRTIAVTHSFPAGALARADLIVPTIAELRLATLLERFA